MADQARDYERERQSFDGAAEVYEAHRPGYPAALIEAVVSAAGIGAGSAVLEIGSGTGKATEAFARLGCSMLCIEPGAKLVAVARRKFADWPGVRFECMRFEDWPVVPEAFDLVLSAQAFHWIAPGVRTAKAAAALKPGGYLAAFWNLYPGMAGPLAEEIERAYAEHAPGMAGSRGIEEQIATRRGIVEDAGRFEPVSVSRFGWSQTHTTAQYLGLLDTYSDHICLDGPARQSLYGAIARAIERHGGRIERPYVAALFMARRRMD